MIEDFVLVQGEFLLKMCRLSKRYTGVIFRAEFAFVLIIIGHLESGC